MMKRSSSLLALALLPAAAFAFPASAADTVTALKVPKAPDLAAGAADPAWAKAQALSVPLIGGKNFKDGKTTATIKAAKTTTEMVQGLRRALVTVRSPFGLELRVA